MKTYFFILFLLISFFGFSQNNHIVKTDDGRRVLLKADFTWEYIDSSAPSNSSARKTTTNSCISDNNFTEPKLNNKIQAELKKGRATIKHIKKKAAKENNTTVDKVFLLSASETKQNGIYDFCVDGIKVRYKRVGNSIIKPLFFNN